MAPGPSFKSFWTNFFPPSPHFTEKDVPDLKGKVYIVTGSNTGIGKEVARILYRKNAKVYIAARSEEKAKRAIESIKATAPGSTTGELIFLLLDLANLFSVQAAAHQFLAQEQKLNVLFNNAGIMVPPVEPPLKTAQDYELSIGVNCVGTFLFTKLLTPLLVSTAKLEPADTVRVVWLSSFGLEISGHENVGVSVDNLDYHIPKPANDRYGVSKSGVWALGVEYARRHKADGIVSVPINPGNLQTELPRDQGAVLKLVAWLMCYPAVNGAYTQLYAAFSPEITIEKANWSENWVIPWGRLHPLRPDLPQATKLASEGGTEGTSKFWDWNEEQIKQYL
ncbi:putative short-chain dehydrogenase [Pseudomassariella vexata]|uniref:Putative short-chain dehydrogenase n=1 Tax=Pseudomassariella vexata TaxID=1141098 RepID=A0A1Y2EL03_9PEZI|nr:putative short-chain dehydrogenase [Pseudomassariella vexata]ORY71964.1 putative short-chain dehydrogenase [Pseudomassariella vexata]